MEFSYTKLSSFLDCPYKFYLRYEKKVELPTSSIALYGSCVHKAIELSYINDLPREEWAKVFKQEWTQNNSYQSVDFYFEGEYLKKLKDGQELMLKYYDTFVKGNKVKPAHIEARFGRKDGICLGDHLLIGIIDQIDTKAVVIDYKTGTPKSRGEVEGKTKFSDGDLFRQLYFYKLLSQLDYNFTPDAASGEFIFLEDKGYKKAKSEVYEYDQAHIDALKDLIKSEMKKIQDHQFEKTKEYRHCQYCDFKQHCWPDGVPND